MNVHHIQNEFDTYKYRQCLCIVQNADRLLERVTPLVRDCPFEKSHDVGIQTSPDASDANRIGTRRICQSHPPQAHDVVIDCPLPKRSEVTIASRINDDNEKNYSDSSSSAGTFRGKDENEDLSQLVSDWSFLEPRQQQKSHRPNPIVSEPIGDAKKPRPWHSKQKCNTNELKIASGAVNLFSSPSLSWDSEGLHATLGASIVRSPVDFSSRRLHSYPANYPGCLGPELSAERRRKLGSIQAIVNSTCSSKSLRFDAKLTEHEEEKDQEEELRRDSERSLSETRDNETSLSRLVNDWSFVSSMTEAMVDNVPESVPNPAELDSSGEKQPTIRRQTFLINKNEGPTEPKVPRTKGPEELARLQVPTERIRQRTSSVVRIGRDSPPLGDGSMWITKSTGAITVRKLNLNAGMPKTGFLGQVMKLKQMSLGARLGHPSTTDASSTAI